MNIEILKSKIHRATVTQADLDYIGSITIDAELLDKAGILPNEKVYIVNNNNGERFETYVIPGERNSGVICLNGAAARKAEVGDVVIVPNVREKLLADEAFPLYIVRGGKVIRESATVDKLTDAEKTIIKDGCLINYYANR